MYKQVSSSSLPKFDEALLKYILINITKGSYFKNGTLQSTSKQRGLGFQSIVSFINALSLMWLPFTLFLFFMSAVSI